jgi:protease I
MEREALRNVRVAVLAADGVEQVELTRPRKRLMKEGAIVDIVSLRRGTIQGVHMLEPADTFDVDRTIRDVHADEYDAIFIPGGLVSPDLLRQDDRVLAFVREFDRDDKPIAAICHGAWVLVSAELVEDRTLTSWPSVRDDIENAGGVWENSAVVHDGNLMTSRGPHDLMAFNNALVRHLQPEGAESGRRVSATPLRGATITGLALAALGYGWQKYQRGEAKRGIRQHRNTAMQDSHHARSTEGAYADRTHRDESHTDETSARDTHASMPMS